MQKERDRLRAEGIDPTMQPGNSPWCFRKRGRSVDQHMRAPALSFDAPVGGEDEGRALSEVVPETLTAPRLMLRKSTWHSGQGETCHIRGGITDERERSFGK